MQGKGITAVAAAKRHTVVLTADGDVYTWGHKVVTPKRVQLAGRLLQFSHPHSFNLRPDTPRCRVSAVYPAACESGTPSDCRKARRWGLRGFASGNGCRKQPNT